MRFTLTYDGPLASSGDARRKHAIRRKFHPQLKALWNFPPLNGNEKWIRAGSGADDGLMLTSVAGHSFASLVIPSLKLYAELEIILLRPEQPGGIVVSGGDIDNRLKTLFDALRCPAAQQEIPQQWQPTPDEQPLFCLLEDDRLISRVSVKTDRLLEPGVQSSDVRLFINVEVRASTATYGNLGIIA